jgi:glycosyltransferase involved in cell wall biosynthesis
VSTGPRVSVIIPVYNPGPYLDLPIESLARQTMPPGVWEAIFVDDGSTDGSGSRLDALVPANDHIRVVHIPNSGWPGTPRNLALDLARGEYIFFLDHDDWLGAEALERMVARADANQADVVMAKEVGDGFGVPVLAFERSIDDAELGRDPLLAFLSPHKLFRRSMLETARIRFPDGKRRLEDHLFVVAAYFASRQVSIMADYPAYHWTLRENNANATHQAYDPVVYYDVVREILDIVDRHTEPGRLRDTLYGHWYRNKVLDKLRGPRWVGVSATSSTLHRFEEIRRITEDRFDSRLDADLPVRQRYLARAVRSNRSDLVRPHAEFSDRVQARVATETISTGDGRIDIDVIASLWAGTEEPVRYARRDGGWVWHHPDVLADPILTSEDLDATSDAGASTVILILRHRRSGVEYCRQFPLDLDAPDRVAPGDVVPVSGRARITLDLGTFAAGGPLADGEWDARVQVWSGGWRATAKVPVDGMGSSPRGWWARPYANPRGHLALRVSGSSGPPIETLPDDWWSEQALRRTLRRYVPVSARRAALKVLERVNGRPSGG